MLVLYNDGGYARIGITVGQGARDAYGRVYVSLREGGMVYREDILARLDERQAWLLGRHIEAERGFLHPWDAAGWLEAMNS